MVFREFKYRSRIHRRSFLWGVGFHVVHRGALLHSGSLYHIFVYPYSNVSIAIFGLPTESHVSKCNLEITASRANMLSTTACSIGGLRMVHGWPYVIVAELSGFICASFVQTTCRRLQFRVYACAGVPAGGSGRQHQGQRMYVRIAMTTTRNPARVVNSRCEIAQLNRLVTAVRGWNLSGQSGWHQLSHD